VRWVKLLAQLGLASSVAEANRLIEQNAVSVNDERISNIRAELDLSREFTYVIKIGKRRFLKVRVGEAL
jgi:tyrosyl-tRNA synthetase